MSQRFDVLAMVLAGGEGRRLLPLTQERAKPAVPFGAKYRLIDIVLSSLVNSGLRKIVVLTQYLSHSLDRHLAQTWRLSPLLGNYVVTVPAQMRTGPRWFAGSADAIYQNLNILGDERPEYVAVFGADHIYRMDIMPMLEQHAATGAGVTVAGIPVPLEEARAFGVIGASDDGSIHDFVEKPDDPPPMPGQPEMAFASMGNYIFNADVLRRVVTEDHEDEDSKNDIGRDIIPKLVAEGRAYVYDFGSNRVPGQPERERGYWRDVGTLDAYYQASMDLVAANPTFDLYNRRWPILSWQYPDPPAKFVHEGAERTGRALNSLVAGGVVISGGTVRRSVLSPRVRINSFAEVEDSVLLDSVDVGRGAVVRRAVIDKNVRIPAGARIGVDLEEDRQRFTISDDGVVVVAKGTVIE
ncbi:MAG: glucose-1-phosphate adenylyltransferase [Acidobacteriota bacterium]|nr:glucose-1-phosphate adenylyltransferase [Acidobacteriota bacterium]